MGKSRPIPWTKRENDESSKFFGHRTRKSFQTSKHSWTYADRCLAPAGFSSSTESRRSQRQSLLATRNRGVASMPRLCTTGPESAEYQNYAARTATVISTCNDYSPFSRARRTRQHIARERSAGVFEPALQIYAASRTSPSPSGLGTVGLAPRGLSRSSGTLNTVTLHVRPAIR